MSDKKQLRAQKAELESVKMEIARLTDCLDEAYFHFNSTTDRDALDACIFEIGALRSRLNAAYKHGKDKLGQN